MIHTVDLSIFYFLNSFANWRPWFDALIIFRAEYLGYWMVAALLVFPIATFFRKYRHLRKKNNELIVFALTAALISRFCIGELIRLFYNRPRPFEVVPYTHQLLFHEVGYAFPSGHALFFFALSAGVSYYYPKTSILFFLGAVSIGIARIQAGVHWPTDVLAGAFLGIVTTMIMRYIILKYKLFVVWRR